MLSQRRLHPTSSVPNKFSSMRLSPHLISSRSSPLLILPKSFTCCAVDRFFLSSFIAISFYLIPSVFLFFCSSVRLSYCRLYENILMHHLCSKISFIPHVHSGIMHHQTLCTDNFGRKTFYDNFSHPRLSIVALLSF